MPKRRKRTWNDHFKLLEYLANHDVKNAAQLFKISEGAVRTWLYKLRRQLKEEQASINRIRTLQRVSARVRKLTTPGEVPEQEEEEW